MQLTTPNNRQTLRSITKKKRPCNRPQSQALTRYEYEEAADSYRDGQEHNQDSERAPVKRLLHKRFPNLVEVKESVLAVSGKGDDGVEHVLVCEDEIDSDRKWKDDLRMTLVNIPD